MNNNIVGTNIKTLREKYKYSQEKLANMLSVSSQAVSKWETGESMPSIESLLKISKIFYTSTDWLITGCGLVENTTKMEQELNFDLREIFFAYHKNESYSNQINDLVAKILPLYNYDKDYYWIYSARLVLKGTIYAILEDKNTTANNINIDCIKKVLQFSNLDTEDRKLKTISYFKDKSNRTKEYLSAYLCAPQSTASSIMSILTTYINILGV